MDFTPASGWPRVFIYVVRCDDWLGQFGSDSTCSKYPDMAIARLNNTPYPLMGLLKKVVHHWRVTKLRIDDNLIVTIKRPARDANQLEVGFLCYGSTRSARLRFEIALP